MSFESRGLPSEAMEGYDEAGNKLEGKEQKGVQSINLEEEGVVEDKHISADGSSNLSHDLRKAEINGKKYFLDGEIKKGDESLEKYSYGYAQLPNGEVKFSRVVSELGNGDKSEFTRDLDADGKVLSSKEDVNGITRRENKFEYDADGKVIRGEATVYDEKGEEIKHSIGRETDKGVEFQRYKPGEDDPEVEIVRPENSRGIYDMMSQKASSLPIEGGTTRNYEERAYEMGELRP